MVSRILESKWTSKLLHGDKSNRGLEQAMPYAEIIKFNSFGASSEGGIPDFSVTCRFDQEWWTKTVWVEVKLLPATGPLFKPLQYERLKRLGGFYIIWDTKDRKG